MGSAGSAIVVGVTGPIGAAVASRFLGAGCKVIGVARNPARCPEVLSQNSNFIFRSLDITSQGETQNFFRAGAMLHGTPAYLIYAAGLAPDVDVPLSEYSLEHWNRTIETYVSGFLICFQLALRALAPKGHIIAISSAVTRFDNSNLPPLFIGHYSAAKAALDELCKWGRRESHERGLLLSRFAPSAVEVPFHQNAPAYRKPPAMVPLPFLADRIVDAALTQKECDEELVATPDGVRIIQNVCKPA